MTPQFRNLVFEGGGVKGIAKMQKNKHLHSDDWQRTLYINTLDVGTTEFDITPERTWTLSPCPDRGVGQRL